MKLGIIDENVISTDISLCINRRLSDEEKLWVIIKIYLLIQLGYTDYYWVVLKHAWSPPKISSSSTGV